MKKLGRGLSMAVFCASAFCAGSAQAQYQPGPANDQGVHTDSTDFSRGGISITPYTATYTPAGGGASLSGAGDGSGLCSRVTNAGGCGGAGGASGGSGGASGGSGDGGAGGGAGGGGGGDGGGGSGGGGGNG